MVINYAMKDHWCWTRQDYYSWWFSIEGTKEEGKEVDMQDMTMKGSSGVWIVAIMVSPFCVQE